jgi:hypothetical protein
MEIVMITKTILFILLLLIIGCGQIEFNEEAIEKTIFGKPLPNRVGFHNHDPKSHNLEINDQTAAVTMQVDPEWTFILDITTM